MTIINQITSFKISGFSYNGTDTQLNYTAGVTAGIAQPSKALVLGSTSSITSGINSLTMTSLVTTNLTVNGTVFSSGIIANLSVLDGVTAGTATANKALIVDGSRDIININSLTSTTLNGTLGTNAQPNITSLGTLTGLISSGAISITNNTASTNTTTGALIVTGGVGIGGATNIGGALSVTGNITGTIATVSQPNITTLSGVTSIGASSGTTLTGTLQTAAQSNVTSVGTLTGLTSSGIVSITNSTASSSTSTGALVITGGVGIGGTLNVGGILNTGNALTTSLSNNTSTFVTYGNFINTGVTPNITTTLQMSDTGSSFGTTSNHFLRFVTNNAERIRLTSSGQLGIGTSAPDRSVEINASDGNCLRLTYNDNDGSATTYLDQSISINGVATLNVSGSAPGFTLSGGAVSITNGTVSTTPTTGALIITGGTGISGNLYLGNILAIGQTTQSASSWTTSGIQLRTGATTYNNSSTSTSGTATSAVFNSFARPTLTATNTSVTTTNAATVYIDNSPLASTNMTITNAYALWVNSGRILFNDNTSSSSTTTGALVITGGIGIGGNLYTSGIINTSQYIQVGTSTDTSRMISCLDGIITVNSNRVITLGSANSAGNQAEFTFNYQGSNNTSNRLSLGFHSSSTILNILNSGNVGIGNTSPSNTLDVTGTFRATGITLLTSGTASTSTTTGTLVVTGGIGISGAVNVGGIIGTTNGTASTSPSTGALVVTGGIGVGGDINSGGRIWLNNTEYGFSHKNTTTGVEIISRLSTGENNFIGTFGNNYFGIGTNNAVKLDITPAGDVLIYNNTVSSSTTTGALVVTGGVGIGGALNVSGNITGTLATAAQTNITSVGNLNALSITPTNKTVATGQTSTNCLWHSTSDRRFGMRQPDTNTLVMLAYSSGGTYNDYMTWTHAGTPALSIAGSVGITDSTSSTSITTGALIVTGGTGISGRVNIGNILAIGQSNQSASSWTTSGIQLRTGANAYTNSSTAASGTATSAVFNSFARPSLLATNASVTTTNAATVYIDNSPLASTNMTITNAYALWIASGRVLFGDSTASSSSTTGALVITGGVGIGGALNSASTLTTSVSGNGFLHSNSGVSLITNVVGTNNIGLFGMSSNHPLGFITNGSERMRIASSGDVSISNSTASSSTTTGALVVTGGVGIGGAVNVGGILSTSSLQLSGTAVTATATELNYNDITTIGTAEASKSLVVDANRDIINIRRISTTNISLNGTTTYPTILHCGATASDKIIGIFNDTTTFYGFGANSNQLRLQTDTSFGFYTGSSNASVGTQRMTISTTSTSMLQNTASTSTTTGTLIVTGGVGISGAVNIGGALSKGSGTFDIKHPIKEKSRLIHSFIEGPRCDLIYRGQVKLINGKANINLDKDCVQLPTSAMSDGTFVALVQNPVCYLQNSTFDRVIGTINNNILTIICENNNSNSLVNWMVIGERKDNYIKQWNKTDENGYLITEYLEN